MRTIFIQATFIAAAVASRHLIGVNVPHDQKDMGVLTADKCYWDGTSPFCAGGCSAGYRDCGADNCGDGKCCLSGIKKHCCLGDKCPDPKTLEAKSHHVGVQPQADNKENGPYDEVCGPDEQLYCIPEANSNEECICVNLPSY